jgi:hypothetical protein
MKYICAQPANLYYAWQVEVMLYNFERRGIIMSDVNIVCAIDDEVPAEWLKLKESSRANFYFYKDTRETNHYISSIRPNILKQHFEANPSLNNETIFYHDCDIVFSHVMNTAQFKGDSVWYGSDTKWYISYDYIISKGQDVFDKMVEVIDIDPQLVIDNNDNSIGAQYVLKNIDASFWSDVERNSENLYKEITAMNTLKKQENPDYHEIQIWCADMWALLWNGWKRGHVTRCHEDLEFSWATSTETEYYSKNILHNAGVTSTDKGLFYKANYMNSLPYGLDLQIKEGTASAMYYYWVQKAEKLTVLHN